MASHFSSIGLPAEDEECYSNYLKGTCENGEFIKVAHGAYIKWDIDSGIELWGQLNEKNKLIGMNPHFFGSSRMSVRIERCIETPGFTMLDGSFYGWADPEEDSDSGSYPFVFDVPDMDQYKDIKLPQIVTVQLSGFAHEVSAYPSDEDFDRVQMQKYKLASEAFIPSGLFDPEGGAADVPEATALFSGHILDTKEIINPVTEYCFYWAKVKTLGGEVDVVIDPEILHGTLVIGGVVCGSYWISGRIVSEVIIDKKGI